jgi:beta-phosphoglucomutase family hydrolase
MIKAVIFDLDGVLVDSIPYHTRTHQAIGKEFGLNLSKNELMGFNGNTNRFIYEALIGKYNLQADPRALDDHYQDLLVKSLPKKMAAMRGVALLIGNLQKKGISLGLASSSRRNFVEEILRKVSLDRMFRVIITGEDIMNGKPAPDIFLKCAKSLEVEPGSCVVIEDAEHGITAARKAGMKCIGYQSSELMDLSAADLLVDDFRKLDVQKILKLGE